MKIQINFTLKIVPDTHEPWKLTAPVHFRSTAFPSLLSISRFSINLPPQLSAVWPGHRLRIPLTHECTAQRGTESTAAPTAASSAPWSTTAPTVRWPPDSRYLLSSANDDECS